MGSYTTLICATCSSHNLSICSANTVRYQTLQLVLPISILNFLPMYVKSTTGQKTCATTKPLFVSTKHFWIMLKFWPCHKQWSRYFPSPSRSQTLISRCFSYSAVWWFFLLQTEILKEHSQLRTVSLPVIDLLSQQRLWTLSYSKHVCHTRCSTLPFPFNLVYRKMGQACYQWIHSSWLFNGLSLGRDWVYVNDKNLSAIMITLLWVKSTRLSLRVSWNKK